MRGQQSFTWLKDIATMKQQQIKDSESIGADVSKATLDITSYFGKGKSTHLVIANKDLAPV
jgi:hypothetical protein